MGDQVGEATCGWRRTKAEEGACKDVNVALPRQRSSCAEREVPKLRVTTSRTCLPPTRPPLCLFPSTISYQFTFYATFDRPLRIRASHIIFLEAMIISAAGPQTGHVNITIPFRKFLYYHSPPFLYILIFAFDFDVCCLPVLFSVYLCISLFSPPFPLHPLTCIVHI